ncbi:glycosyltransferase family 2 protein [Lysobacter korlensis]|uniref:Glycosyltransferase family 2 protein n=1 Tax=Lysobacter korlensis TaxID=553636 RepID=A0ABV6RIX5_9GAMM
MAHAGSGATLPLVVVPVGTDEAALDGCLAALDRTTPAGTRVWLADDAQAGPRALALIERWRRDTPLRADYTRRARSVGEVAHLDEVLSACGDIDTVVLASDAIPAPGWLSRMAQTLANDRAIATVTPWSNAGEAASWPRIGEVAPMPGDLHAIAAAAAAMPLAAPELPAAVGHAVLLRGIARQRAGGLDTAGYGSWYAALTDLSLRLAGLGWRNVLCENAFVARLGEGRPADGDMQRLAARWPDWHPRLANFVMRDPLRVARERLCALAAMASTPGLQPELFDGLAVAFDRPVIRSAEAACEAQA